MTLVRTPEIAKMPVHDWAKAPGGYFHHFHQQWTVALCDALNAGLLPEGVFSLIELSTGSRTQQAFGASAIGGGFESEPPKTRFVSKATEEVTYAAKANQIALHRGDETIAVIELVSPGNKGSVLAMRQFVEKSAGFLERGIHLLAVDLFPPTRRDPQGIHGAIWGLISDDSFVLPADKPLTLASYVAAEVKTAYVEPVAVGDVLPDMPVFLDSGVYVRVPLEQTYEETWRRCPEEFKGRVTGASS